MILLSHILQALAPCRSVCHHFVLVFLHSVILLSHSLQAFTPCRSVCHHFLSFSCRILCKRAPPVLHLTRAKTCSSSEPDSAVSETNITVAQETLNGRPRLTSRSPVWCPSYTALFSSGLPPPLPPHPSFLYLAPAHPGPRRGVRFACFQIHS